MSLIDSLRVAYDSLTAHLLRTLLAMLGLVIGVGAVITLLAVGHLVPVKAQDLIIGALPLTCEKAWYSEEPVMS